MLFLYKYIHMKGRFYFDEEAQILWDVVSNTKIYEGGKFTNVAFHRAGERLLRYLEEIRKCEQRLSYYRAKFEDPSVGPREMKHAVDIERNYVAYLALLEKARQLALGQLDRVTMLENTDALDADA